MAGMTSHDDSTDCRRSELEKQLKADRRFRDCLLQALRETTEATPAVQQVYRLNLERTLAEVDRRLVRRALLVSDLVAHSSESGVAV
jgi:hypothetical protein